MATYLVSCHNCDHTPYYVTLADTDPAPTSCQYCGSTDVDVVQVA